MSWVLFSAQILRELIPLARDLYRRTHGDLEAAKQEIHRIRDHGLRFDESQTAFEARYRKLIAKE